MVVLAVLPHTPIAMHVRPWQSCMRAVDMFLPGTKTLIHHDGASHERLMPVDRARGVSKRLLDALWDSEAACRGFKVLRLHWRDENMWEYYVLRAAVEQKLGILSPLCTPTLYFL